MNIRAARVEDVPAIHDLIKAHAKRDKMILRTFEELHATLREFVVCETDGQVVGCVATHIFSPDLAELRCLAVRDDFQRRGIGAALCRACHDDLLRLGVSRLFALTTSPGFFEKIGYRRVQKETLPQFIWGECVRCPTFPICNEEALIRDVKPTAAGRGVPTS